MDVTRMLEADHRTVEGLFAEIEDTKGEDRATLVHELATSLKAHMQLEETVVYPKAQSVVGKEAVEEGENEHKVARAALAEMVSLTPDEPGFTAALDAVKAAIDHHVKEEEDEMFPKLRSNGPRVLEDMATPFMTKRTELGLPMEAAALAAAASKDELVEEARSAGIDGAASMNKDQLAEALAANMA